MTAKRFTDVWCSETGHIGFTDNGIDKELTGSEFEEFLNNLHEENQALKSSNMEYEDALARFEEENKFLRNKVATYKTGNRLLKESMNKEWK